jgi:peptide/nickel transport system ATP-binding protein
VRFRQHDGRRLTPLEGLSLGVSRGEVVGLIGGSGAGKSLVAEALLGLLPRNAEIEGRLEVDGAPLRKGCLALAPQAVEALDPLQRIGAQIRHMGRLAGREADAARLLAEVGLEPGIAEAFPFMLSGGMAKRALIATALAAGAPFLIADEPTIGVDPEAADRLMALIAGLADAKRGVLLISHDLTRLAAIAQRLVILENGRLIETVEAADFRAGALRHPFSRALKAAQVWDAPC